MITKEQVQTLKDKNPSEIYNLLNGSHDSQEVLFVLKHLGHLPNNFKTEAFFPFINHKNDDIRFWAIKNIGKIPNPDAVNLLINISKNDSVSMVRREAVSSLGRMRLKQTQDYLLQLLDDTDPKIVLQAIRGLLIFKKDPQVRKSLNNLINHPNETVQSVIRREFSVTKNSSNSKQQHSCSADFLKNLVVNGDVREIIKFIPDDSIHLTFTSPPYYNARDYSIYESYNAYLEFLDQVFEEVHRITKEGRFLIVNTSPVIIPRVSRAHSSKRYPIPFDLHNRLVKKGWEFIDDIVWLKPESSVKNRNAGFLQHRKPLGYKPNPVTEYLMVYRKETDKLLDWNMHQYDWKTIELSRVKNDYETSNVWKIDPTFDKIHSAVFPIELCNRVINFYSYVGDLVFDPFGGSGTLGKAAKNLKRYFLMTEQEIKYIERMKVDLEQSSLFQKSTTRFLNFDEFRTYYEENNDNNNR